MGHCPICHSDAFYRHGVIECPNSDCQGLTDEEWALRTVLEWWLHQRPDPPDPLPLEELERRVLKALTNPPSFSRGMTVFR